MTRRIRAALPLAHLALRVLLSPAFLAAQPEIRLDDRNYRLYGVCPGSLHSPEGFSGTVELRGRRFDGREVPLFRADLSGWTASLEFRIIPDETVRTLFVAGHGYERELPLPAGGTDEEAGRKLLRSLAVPFRSWAPGRLPGTVRLRAREPRGAGAAAARLFASPADPLAAGILAACAAAALALASLSERLGRWYRPLLLVFAGAGILAAGISGLPDAVLFRFPLPDHRGPYDLTATVEIVGGPGFEVVTFRPAEAEAKARSASLEVLGTRTPPGRDLPLSTLPRGVRLKFLQPPLVVRDPDGAYSLRFEGFALGWALHD